MKNFDFEVKDHVEIAEKLNFLDYDKAIKLSGVDFLSQSDLAKLYRALINFMMDINEIFNYEECIVPELIKEECLIGTSQLPKFVDDLLELILGFMVNSYSRSPLTNFHRNELLISTPSIEVYCFHQLF